MMPFANESQAARTAQVTWAKLSLRERLEPVARLRGLLVTRRDDITQAIADDVERRPVEVLVSDVLPCASACKYLLTDAKRILAPRKVGRNPLWLVRSRDVVERRPRGVVGIIGTWNYPLFLNLIPMVQAFTAGNAVMWKPSENTPKFAAVLTKLIHDAGYPKELLQTLPTNREAGPMLAEADMDFLHFTGSEGVGRKLAAKLGERLIPSALELSGCDAFMVFANANIAQAARGAWFGLTLNSGQTCLAVRRIFVHKSIREAFVNALREVSKTAKPMRVLRQPQVAQVERCLQEAAGCELIQAPGQPGEREFAPTVILDAKPQFAACQEALFAPLAALMTFENVAELQSLESQCGYALGCSVFGQPDTRWTPRSGLVCQDDVIVPAAHPGSPLTGVGRSGWGASQGDEGLLEMTVPQTIAGRRSTFRPEIDTALKPHDADGQLLAGMLEATHADGFGARVRGARKMLAAIWATRRR
ncbi:MAG: aldehyde dehydrogenase family protein [Fimbriiglobus sp.]